MDAARDNEAAVATLDFAIRFALKLPEEQFRAEAQAFRDLSARLQTRIDDLMLGRSHTAKLAVPVR